MIEIFFKKLLSEGFGFFPGTEGISGDRERRHWWQAETLRLPVGFFCWRFFFHNDGAILISEL